MCGINIIIGKDPENRIQSMMAATAHRGPDHSAHCQVNNQLHFAANRLKILDLSDASNQPLWTERKDAVLVWNGAIYNYQDLRNQLLNWGYSFRTNSDSEVLLYWLKHQGKEGVQSLKGMFALAFADLEKNSLIIARDPSGEKPLYYSEENGNWFFSSECKPIVFALKQKPTIDTGQFPYFFFLRHAHPGQSFFKGIQQFPTGTCWTMDLEGNNRKEFACSLHTDLQKTPEYSKFEDLLKDAVLKNFHAERPVGSMLSGGADSSLLYALWYEETMVQLPTFTVCFEEKFQKKYSDPLFAKRFGKKYPSFNHPVEITFQKIQDNWKKYIQSLDQPIGDSAGILTWMLAQEASKQVKVLISGAGADELFGGYNRHKAYLSYHQHPKFWHFLKNSGIAKFLPANWEKMVKSIEDSPSLTYIQMAALENLPKGLLEELQYLYPRKMNGIKSALDWDRTIYLVNDILKIHDNACMAHGIEGRAPYLDTELIALSQHLNEEKHRELIGKQWIKASLEKRNLDFVGKRKKLGFGLPLKEWLSDRNFRHWVFEPIQKMEKEWGGFFPQEMRNLALNPAKAEGREFLQVWNLFLLASWLKENQ
ncbi:asparagine synthase (glutamine-hydrolyzing) [Cecembia calidifontis]|uniref:asparagine synthase (glutamine-hydrolyzing) n=1 Tax=Cecembia calidifontis TaxID=1187080 RepID=A0A4Q7P602_9BACT|nr:asparagine synthase (glutamine-hydrolyzing) [Cecembia calidifontis]RZS95187.1 asparagine synthase (glutamine-hydrolysing) [Cecembia calidifontis]